ncbi:hypothetical protein M569_03656, partial [Genlisea aurea]
SSTSKLQITRRGVTMAEKGNPNQNMGNSMMKPNSGGIDQKAMAAAAAVKHNNISRRKRYQHDDESRRISWKRKQLRRQQQQRVSSSSARVSRRYEWVSSSVQQPHGCRSSESVSAASDDVQQNALRSTGHRLLLQLR